MLVVEETLSPTRNAAGVPTGGYQAKVAGTSGIACTFTGTLNGLTYDSPAPIYRRVKQAVTGSTDVLIAHTNTEEISKFQQAANAANKPAAGIRAAAANVVTPPAPVKDTAALEAEADTLEAIPEASRTRAQKTRLKAVLAELATV